MPIARLSFPEGEPIPPDPSKILEAVTCLVVANLTEIVFLNPGEYEITPESWEHNKYTHHLTVFDNDTGVYRMLPVYKDSEILDSHRLEQGFTGGGRTRRIPQDESIVVVAGPTADLQSLQVYEVITRLP